MKRILFVVSWRDHKWQAREFRGGESWETLSDPDEYNVTVVLVVASDHKTAAKIAEARPQLDFPEVLVEGDPQRKE